MNPIDIRKYPELQQAIEDYHSGASYAPFFISILVWLLIVLILVLVAKSFIDKNRPRRYFYPVIAGFALSSLLPLYPIHVHQVKSSTLDYIESSLSATPYQQVPVISAEHHGDMYKVRLKGSDDFISIFPNSVVLDNTLKQSYLKLHYFQGDPDLGVPEILVNTTLFLQKGLDKEN